MIATKIVDVDISVEDAANAFIEMDENEQAQFFNIIAKSAVDWSLEEQIQCIAASKVLTKSGEKLMEMIGQSIHDVNESHNA